MASSVFFSALIASDSEASCCDLVAALKNVSGADEKISHGPHASDTSPNVILQADSLPKITLNVNATSDSSPDRDSSLNPDQSPNLTLSRNPDQELQCNQELSPNWDLSLDVILLSDPDLSPNLVSSDQNRSPNPNPSHNLDLSPLNLDLSPATAALPPSSDVTPDTNASSRLKANVPVLNVPRTLDAAPSLHLSLEEEAATYEALLRADDAVVYVGWVSPRPHTSPAELPSPPSPTKLNNGYTHSNVPLPRCKKPPPTQPFPYLKTRSTIEK
eukprot:Platyproteum_vivax@DN12166_c0_g1_i1.p1